MMRGFFTGGSPLVCLGVSETVSGREYEFVSDLEKPEVLRAEIVRLPQPGMNNADALGLVAATRARKELVVM